MEKKIEKPWAVYKGVIYSPIGIGLVVKEEKGGSLYLLYSEGQLYSEECWDPDYVSRFDTPTEAVSYFIERRGGHLERELKRLSEKFPKFISAQRSPKCKEEVPRSFNLCGHYNDPAAGSYKSHGH